MFKASAEGLRQWVYEEWVLVWRGSMCVIPQPEKDALSLSLKWDLGLWGFLHTNSVMRFALPKYMRIGFQFSPSKKKRNGLSKGPMMGSRNCSWQSVYTHTLCTFNQRLPVVGTLMGAGLTMQNGVLRSEHGLEAHTWVWTPPPPVLAPVPLGAVNEGIW